MPLNMPDNESIIHRYKVNFEKDTDQPILDMDTLDVFQFPFTATRLEFITEHLKGKYPLNRQTPHLIAFVKKGGGNEIIGHYRFPITDNMLFIVPSRVVHSSEFIGDEFKGYIICFNLDFIVNKALPRHLVDNKSVLSGNLLPFTILSEAQAAQIESVMECLTREYDENNIELAANELISIKIIELLILCDRFFMQNNREEEQCLTVALIGNFNVLLEKYFASEHGVVFYAKALCLHPNRLNAFVKQHTGKSAKMLINLKITNESKYLLSNSELSIKEISFRLGFEDPNYFSYFFRRETGLSPMEYRQQRLHSGTSRFIG